MFLFWRTILFWVLIILADAGRHRHHHGGGKQGLKSMRNRGIGMNFLSKSGTTSNTGLWPAVFNVATKSVISVNATCGEGGREEYCRMSESSKGRCYVCDNFSPDPTKQHPIHHAIDGTGKWWQSPALYRGREYEYVTITLDLKQVYQVAYVIIKSAISPRPGSWILERSLDGETFTPWQYFGTSDKDCLERYGIQAKKGKPHYSSDTEIICTTFYSKLMPIENGEIHTSLVHGRPGANGTSPELLEFTKARYVRFRLQGLRGTADAPLPKRLSQDNMRDRKLFYSIKDINIGGQCVCNGHASSCRHNVASGHPECECTHHTCGPNCDRCCPLYNQRTWGPGTPAEARQCLPCNCHGHAKSCHYDEDIDRAGLSMDVNGNYQGGGVCDNCTSHTVGINCERCIRGYYRPKGVSPSDKTPCLRCDCNPLGSTGSCTVDDDTVVCDCRPGYTGPRCDSCVPGFRGFPNCEVCPCDTRGTANISDCEGQCMCKVNAEGAFCERCKSGYFSLRESNPDGCFPCYCSGVTNLCESAILVQQTIKTKENWHVCDVSVSSSEKVYPDEQGILSIANYEVAGGGPYYWLAPSPYLGNKLIVYGSVFTFRLIWIVMRGDTSGKPTKGPNIILVGRNGKKIAYGNDLFSSTNVTFRIPFTEYDWYYFDATSSKDTITTITRSDFLSILTDIKHILLRAKFHADQIDVALEEAAFNIGEGISAVEKCSCPSGYVGLSCESCDYGYVRIIANSSNGEEQSFCGKCDCNGHSKTCDPDTGQCLCEHNTTGENCDRCLPGYYGNPMIGMPNDCKQCACPLLNEENNFSPSCQLDLFKLTNENEEQGYVCTQCPRGYTGDHCEICDDGYYGSPTVPGQKCQQCSCGGNPCDRKTGQCLACKGNTEGWRCERCKPGYFGNPTTGSCQACLCDLIGSQSEECNNVTGQCPCKDKFVGRTCDGCIEGYGNKTADCVRCDCNEIGSKSPICDPKTGLCDCRSGVEGFHCDACQHLHYGFSEMGCQSCNCNPRGSELTTCDIKTGNCRCKLHYIGRTCDKCEIGYWENINNCIKCDCNIEGSRTTSCEHSTGQCYCKEGVGGSKCNICAKGYYDFSAKGCKQCEDCTKPGHICDPKTGRCVCPPNSHGIHCEKCLSNTWGHEPEIGCKKCNCSKFGTKKPGCDIKTGQCSCDTAYSGQNCDKCANGYYGYPKCRPCNCNKAGTHCTDHLCQCNENGQCPCKTNVIGKACDQCKEETFGLDMSNPNGCTECFCFGRSTKCANAAYTWDQIPSNQIISDNLTQKFNSLYWRLPQVFKGDRLLSYNGYLRFKIESSSNNLPRIRNDPLVILEGNRLTIHRNLPSSLILQKYEVQLQENMWRTYRNTKVSRVDFMVLLQNVTDIYIKASDAIARENSVLVSVTLDTATEVRDSLSIYKPAIGIEKCECPSQYTGTSCQTPSLGYCKKKTSYDDGRPPNFGKIIIDHLIGRSVPCECNGRSNACDSETCKCQNCTDHTAGDKCEKCAEGFHGSPNEICRPCPCPTTERNFAIGCDIGQGTCYCKPGYEGLKCEQCSEDYYGDPLEEGGSCQPCDCNPGGITRHGCDIKGQCYCRSGITGRKCSQCDKPRHILENNICVPCDDCTQKLLDQLDDMQAALHGNTSHLLYSELEPPWRQLEVFEDRYSDLAEQVKLYSAAVNQAKNVVDQANLDKRINEVEKIEKAFATKKLKLDVLSKDINRNHNQSLNTLMGITSNKQDLEDFTNYLNNFGKSHVSTREAVREGKAILKHMQHQYEKVQNINEDAVINACTSVRNVLDQMMKNNKTNRLIDLDDKLTEANEFLDSLSKILMQTNHTLGQVENKNELNEERLNRLAAALLQNANITHAINTKLNTTNDYITKANKAMNEVEILLTKIVDEFLDDRIEELKTRRDKFKNYIRLLKDKLDTARDHARMLDEKLQYMQDVFQKDDKQVNAEKASEAYSTIVTLLQEANETASEANTILRKFKEEIEPTDMDSLYDKVYIMSANASQLENRILNILNLRSQEVKDRMAAIENRLNGIKNRNWDNGIKDRELNILIDQLLVEQNEVDVEGLIADAMEKSQKMKDTYKRADEMNLRIRYDLKKEAEKLKNMASPEETAEVKRKINETRQQLRNTVINFTDVSFDRDEGRFKLGNDKVVSKLEELKRRVQKAKSIADGIRVSMSGRFCARSYKLSNLEPSLITNLKMRFTLNKASGDKLYSMFLLANNEGQFIQLVVIKNSIKFLIKLQKEEKELEMDLSEDNINLSIERFYNTVTMTVNNKTTNAVLKHGNVRFDVNPTNLVYVGNASSMAGLPGCIHDITFNGKNIGLWEFEQTTSCQGCSRSTIISSSTQIYRFNGEGFAMIKKNPVKTPQDLYISFWFKTFDENAILFLSPHTESSSYLALTLHDGHLQYEVHYNGDEIPPVILKTQEKYNDGEKHLIILTKVYENKIEHSKLKVDSSVDQHSTNINGSLLLKVKKTNFSVGGVAPDYFIDSKNVTYSLHTHQSFLGDIENFQVITSIIQLHETSEALNQYGVQLTNKPLEFRKAWFEGAGYLKLKEQSVKLENLSIIFLVRTVDDNSLLMEIENLTIFTIRDGYINVDIDGKSLHSKFKINDDEFHVIELLNKNIQDYILRIDGSKADKSSIISKQTSRESASIYIGGKPHMTDQIEYFNGEISDIFINNKLLKFGTSTIDSFEKVKIGHSKPKVIKHPVEDTMVKDNLRSRVLTDPTDNPKDQQSIDGCDRSTNNSLELNAAKFGDMSESYVKYYLKEQFWKEDFSVELDFRTFYKNGILLYAQSDLKHYNLIELKDGSVTLHFVGKRKKALNISKRLDDGEWHKLLIENKSKKRKRKLTITIDGRKEKPKKVPPNRVFGDVFIGGIPQIVQQKLPKQLLTKLTPFKGCIKELKINQAPQSFIHHHNIGLCFSNIEKGSYFGGDAYVVYKRDFKVTNFLELKFEFRTREQNGILMSVSAINNSPALSLELQNGAVVMSVDMGNGVVSNVTNFHSAYALCDNKWHNVTALFSTELTVNVDGVSKSWVISGMGLVDNIEDPLYIGGLPDIAPAGTLKIKENFKGCIRNVKIGDNYIDWIDMEELTNVSLNSCPVA